MEKRRYLGIAIASMANRYAKGKAERKPEVMIRQTLEPPAIAGSTPARSASWGFMVICPKCGAKNGQRTDEPVKCTRCWYRFDREVKREVQNKARHEASFEPDGIRPKVEKTAYGVRIEDGRHPIPRDPASEIPSAEARVCVSCEGELTESRGKLACMDQGCGMYGREQKGKKQ